MVWITATTISWFWKQSKIIQRIYSTILLNVWFDCVSYLRHICHKCCYHQRHKCVVWNLYPNDEVTKNSNISPSWNCGTIFELLITYLVLAPKIFKNTPIIIFWILYFCIRYWYFIKIFIVYTSKRNVITKYLISQSNQKCNFMILCNHFIQRWAWYLFFCPFEDPPYKHWQHWKTFEGVYSTIDYNSNTDLFSDNK